MTGFIIVHGAPQGWGLDLGGGAQLRHGLDSVAATIAEAQAAGYTVASYGPESAVVPVLRGVTTSSADLRLWDHIAGSPPARAELVDFTSPAQMRVALVPSVTIDLQARITRIDWLAPDAVPADPFGERFAGTVVLVELRTWTEGPLGPVARTDTLQALLADGTVGETWTRSKRYDGRISAERGAKRREECVARMTTWLGVAAARDLGGDADAAILAVAGWGATVADARTAFESRADPSGLIAAITGATDPWWSVPCAAIGLDVGAGPTVRDAVLASLSTWVPA